MYRVALLIYSCSTIVGMFVNVYINRDDLGRAMTTFSCVDSRHQYYVDIFILQVSNNTGCHFCSIINVKKFIKNILKKL